MNYLVRLMNKSEVLITGQEYQNLAGKSGLVHIPSQDRIINTNSVVEIVSEEDVKQERTNNLIGVLHDGKPAVRQFGRWYADDGNIDEQGKLQTAVDPLYYPEVARDCVPSPQEYYEKYAELPKEERLKLMIGGTKKVSSGGEFKKLSDFIKDKKL
jgi:hypothetical protein